jgi:hypothetical protein
MTEWEQEDQDGQEEQGGDQGGGGSEQESGGWGETNDEPAQGEQGQDAV